MTPMAPGLVADNLPTPLADAPIVLLADGVMQMSFGERAALEGVLCQLRPSVAVEVGSAAGGSLARLAAYSGEVHAFDLALPSPPDSNTPVGLHIGDSRYTLPTWLADQRMAVDFALVDGDHSSEGVYADLTALLGSPCCARTVILLHDSSHPATRRGIQDALEGAQGVIYADLDFLPGYEFTRGSFAGQPWGGFALVITGSGPRQAQDLYRRI